MSVVGGLKTRLCVLCPKWSPVSGLYSQTRVYTAETHVPVSGVKNKKKLTCPHKSNYKTVCVCVCLCRTPCPVGESVSVIFDKLPLAISLHFTPFRLEQTFVFEMCLVRSTVANMYPSRIHFDDLDFGECCSKEVMNFF